MQDKTYQSVKWIAIGILIGYAGKYALHWLRTKSQANPDQSEESEMYLKSNQ